MNGSRLTSWSYADCPKGCQENRQDELLHFGASPTRHRRQHSDLGFFFQCDGILEGVLYLSITKGKKVWPLPLRASPLIKHRTERRYDEKGPVSLQHVVVYINITLLDWGFCGNRGNQLELINIVLYWLLHRQLKVAFRWLNNGGRFLKVHWTLISPCPFYI